MSHFGTIEAGGTKFVCAVGSGPDHLQNEIRFPTTTPQETLQRCLDYFRQQQEKQPLEAIGIGAFGPIHLDPESPQYGHVSQTPKPHWSGADFVGPFQQAFKIPIGFDTDVNAAALGEHRWGAGQDVEDLIYITVGTGIGGGALIQGKLLHGLLHPEMGHMLLRRNHQQDAFPGRCPFHGDCLEGLAAGPAIQDRWGKPGSELLNRPEVWELEADYLAQAIANLCVTLSPKRVILGGGVMENQTLFPLIRQKVLTYLNGYIQHSAILSDIDRFIVPPGLGNQAGILGGIALAEQALANFNH